MNRNPKDLFDPNKGFIIYLVVGWVLAIASNIITDLVLRSAGVWAETKFGISKPIFRLILLLLILVPLLLIFYFSKLSKWLENWYTASTVRPEVLKERLPGLVVVASKGRPDTKSAAQAAIEYHWDNGNGNLQHCWIICGGRELEEQVRQMLTKLGSICKKSRSDYIECEIRPKDNFNRVAKVSLRTIKPEAVDDPNTTFTLVNKIYDEAEKEGIEEQSIIADYTGGTKSMTSGIILACATPQRRLQFMKPGGYLDDGRADHTQEAKATEVQVAFKLKPIKK